MALGKVGEAFIQIGGVLSPAFGQEMSTAIEVAMYSKASLLGAGFEKLGKALFTRFTLPLAAGTAANVAQFAQLERSIAEVLTLFGTAQSLVDETFSEMAEGISGVSQEVGGLEHAIADGLYQAISAGVPRGSVFEFLDVAQMAAIADKTADLTTSVDGITTAVQAFGLEWTDAGDVADKFFATVAKGKTTFGELSSDLGRVAPLAANAGVTLNETLAVLGQLTVQGLKTSEAVSFLRAAITGILRPSEELNDIFEEIGYSSAEAAIPTIGLQAAFETVVDAAGGSTSKLQELIGTSEGVSAILGVTGENAENFATILNSVENSAGSTARAFEIVDGTVSRSFGKLTEAFDSLGTFLGSLAAEVVQPAVDAMTGVVLELLDVFKAMAPVLRNVGKQVAKVFAVFSVPVVKQVAAALVAVGLAFSSILGVTGLLVLVGAKLFNTWLGLTVVSKVLGGIKTAFISTRASVVSASVSMQNFGASAKVAEATTTRLGAAVGRVGKTLQATRASFIATAGLFAVIAIAVGQAVVAWSNMHDRYKEVYEDNLIFSKGLDTLTDSLGLANQELSLYTDALDSVEDREFIQANEALIESVRNIRDELGEAAAQRLLISIAAQLQWLGNTPEDAYDAIQQIADIAGIEIPITLGNIIDKSETDELNDLYATITDLADLTLKYREENAVGLLGGAVANDNANIDNLVDGLTRAYAIATDLGQQEKWLDNVKAVGETIASQGGSIDDFFDDIFKSVSELDGVKADGFYSLFEFANLSNIEQKFRDAGIVADEFWNASDGNGEGRKKSGETSPPTPPVIDLQVGEIDSLENWVRDTGDVLRIGQAQAEVLAQLRRDIPGIFEGAEQVIADALGSIEEHFLNQIPLLGEYTGAMKLGFDQWKDNQNQFSDDLKAVEDVRDSISKTISPELLAKFDALSLADQAWFAALKPDQLKEALEILETNLEDSKDVMARRIESQKEAIVEDVNTFIAEELAKGTAAAAEQGDAAAYAYITDFEKRARSWDTSVRGILARIAAIVSGTVIPGPIIGGATYVGGVPQFNGRSEQHYDGFNPSGGTTNITINNPDTNNLVDDASTALLIGQLAGG